MRINEENFVEKAERAIKVTKEKNGKNELTTAQLRNIGREKPKKTMETFVNETELLDVISEIGDSKQNFIMFHRYMEALVAYHKYYGGKEQ